MSLLLTSRRLLHSAAQRMVAASTAAHSGTGDLLSIFTSTEESQGLNTSQYTSAPAQTKAKCALASSNLVLAHRGRRQASRGEGKGQKKSEEGEGFERWCCVHVRRTGALTRTRTCTCTCISSTHVYCLLAFLATNTTQCEHTLQDANAFFVVNPKDEPLVSNVFLKRRRCEEIKQQGFCSFLLRQQALQAAQLLDASEVSAHLCVCVVCVVYVVCVCVVLCVWGYPCAYEDVWKGFLWMGVAPCAFLVSPARMTCVCVGNLTGQSTHAGSVFHRPGWVSEAVGGGVSE